jgi:hypothetical protein
VSNQRSETRQRCFLGAQLAFNHRRSTFNCVIRDISRGGARLEFAAVDTMPDEFDLHIPHSGRDYRAKVMWRRATLCGVSFVAREAA